MREKERLLGEALHKVLIACGVLNAESEPTGTELICAADDFCSSKQKKKKKKTFKKGQLVKHSEHYFDILREAGCTEESFEYERNMIMKIVQIPCKHGTRSSIGVSPIDDDSTIIACTRRDIVLCQK